MGAIEDPQTPVEARAYRLKQKEVDQIESTQPPLCDSCGELQIFGNAVGLRIKFTLFELCATCSSKLRGDFNDIGSWLPPKHYT